MKKSIIFIILCLSVLFLLKFWHSNADRFTKKFDPVYFSELYSNSQYVLGPKSIGGIGDDGLYAFAGFYYFFQGGDVSAVNFEHPPLGKYLIGLSIFIFKNEIFINIIYFLILLFVTYKTSRLFLDKYLSLLPLAVLMFDPLFLDHTIRSQLDLPFTLFFVSGIYFFMRSFSSPGKIFFSQLFLSFAFATRFFPFLLVLEIYMLILIYFKNTKTIKNFILSTLIIPSVYLITHISFFIYHPSLIEFLRHKKWMLAWFTGTPVKPGNILRNLFTGKLFDTLDNLTVNKEWSILQPAVTVLSFIPFRLSVLFGFVLLYFLYDVFLTGGQAKFLMPIFPFMAVLAIKNLEAVYSIIHSWMRLKSQPSKIK